MYVDSGYTTRLLAFMIVCAVSPELHLEVPKISNGGGRRCQYFLKCINVWGLKQNNITDRMRCRLRHRPVLGHEVGAGSDVVTHITRVQGASQFLHTVDLNNTTYTYTPVVTHITRVQGTSQLLHTVDLNNTTYIHP